MSSVLKEMLPREGRMGGEKGLGNFQVSSLSSCCERSISLYYSTEGHGSCGWPLPGSSKWPPLSPSPRDLYYSFYISVEAPSISCRAPVLIKQADSVPEIYTQIS